MYDYFSSIKDTFYYGRHENPWFLLNAFISGVRFLLTEISSTTDKHKTEIQKKGIKKSNFLPPIFYAFCCYKFHCQHLKNCFQKN